MFVALVKKGICGGGCGDLGRAAEIVGGGVPYLAECKVGELFFFCFLSEAGRYDFLVARLDTSSLSGGGGPEAYDLSAVPPDLVKALLERHRDLVCRVWEELEPVLMVFTRNPYLPRYAVGVPMSPLDVIDLAWRREGRRFAAELLAKTIDELEALVPPAVVKMPEEKPPEACRRSA